MAGVARGVYVSEYRAETMAVASQVVVVDRAKANSVWEPGADLKVPGVDRIADLYERLTKLVDSYVPAVERDNEQFQALGTKIEVEDAQAQAEWDRISELND